jgi:hypothetical protein
LQAWALVEKQAGRIERARLLFEQGLKVDRAEGHFKFRLGDHAGPWPYIFGIANSLSGTPAAPCRWARPARAAMPPS